MDVNIKMTATETPKGKKALSKSDAANHMVREIKDFLSQLQEEVVPSMVLYEYKSSNNVGALADIGSLPEAAPKAKKYVHRLSPNPKEHTAYLKFQIGCTRDRRPADTGRRK